MSTATDSRLAASGNAYPVQSGGRIFPVAQRGSRPAPSRIDSQTDLVASSRMAPSRKGRKPQAAAKKKALAEQMAVGIWERLPLASKSLADFNESPEIVRCFNESHGQLVDMAAEARRLLETICRAHIDAVRDDRLDEGRQRQAEEAKVRECMDFAMPAAWLGPESNFKTVAQAPPVVMEKLTKSLVTSVCQFVESFFTALEQLVDKEVVGVIEWCGESTCKFHFFRRLIIHKFAGQTTTVKREQLWDALDDWDFPRAKVTTTTTEKVRHVHEHIRYEQQLMEAGKRPLDSPELVIPQPVQEIVDVLPRWLTPFVSVAVGECFRERIIRHTEKTELKERVVERAITYFDPAVTIGEFVLVGWGQREEAAEMERRSRASQVEISRRKTKDAVLLAAVIYGFGSLLLLLSLLFFPKLALPSLAVCFGAIVPLNLAVVHSGRRGSVKASIETFFLTNMSGLALIAMTALLTIAVMEKRVLPAAAAGVLLCLFLPIFRAVIPRLRPRPALSDNRGQ